MMKAYYLIALGCIFLAACGDTQEPTASRADRIEMLNKHLDKAFATGRIYRARMEEDGMHLETEKKGNIVISPKELKELELEKLEHGASMHAKENRSFVRLQLFNDAYATHRCRWTNCPIDHVGQTPGTCPYAC
jgi:hypothetical protein